MRESETGRHETHRSRWSAVLLFVMLLTVSTGCAWNNSEVREDGPIVSVTDAAVSEDGNGETAELEVKTVEQTDKEATGETADESADKEAKMETVPVLRMDTSARHQIMEGFGTSGCWWAQAVGTWDIPVREQVARWLFDKQEGIGLTIYRFNVGAGEVNEAQDPWRRVESFETAPGEYDWSRDAGSVDMLRRAVAAGADNVVFFANSPPGRILRNGRTTGDDQGESNLIPDMEPDFAKYLADIADHFSSEGIPIRYISPVNEPQWNWKLDNGQEGCHYTPDGVATMGLALLEELDARGSEIQVSLADSGKMFDEAYTIGLYKRLATDPAFADRLPHFSAHAYWSAALDKKLLATALQELGNPLPLWQSEWCQMEGGRDPGMDPALVLARCVHEDLTILDCTSWQNWIAVTRYDYKDGLIEADPETKTVSAMKRMWALGNWSRFVRPGSIRVEMTGMPEGVLASGWLLPDGGRAVVLVNETEAPVTVSLLDADGVGRVWEAWETSVAHDLSRTHEALSDLCVLSARSVTTLVSR